MKQNRYEELKAYAQNMGDTNFCSVIAVAVIMNLDYKKAYRLCAKFGRKHGKGMHTYDILKLLRLNNIEYKDLLIQRVLETVDRPNYRVKTLTTNNFKMSKLYNKGSYLMFVNGHVAAVKNGVTHDWSENRAKKIQLLFAI